MGRLGSRWFVSAWSSPPGLRLYPEHTYTSGALISRPDNTGHDQTSQNKTPAAGSSSSPHTDTDLDGTIDRTHLMQPDTQQLFCVIYLYIYLFVCLCMRACMCVCVLLSGLFIGFGLLFFLFCFFIFLALVCLYV